MESVRRIRHFATAALVFLAVPACATSSVEEFPVPEDLCGVEIDQESLTPLLPAGTDFRSIGDMSGSRGNCLLRTYDGTASVSTTDALLHIDVSRGEIDPYSDEAVRESSLGITDTQSLVGIPGEAVYGVEGVLGRIECHANGESGPGVDTSLNDLILRIWIYETADRRTGEDRLEGVEKFARSYIDNLRDHLGCDT